MATGYLGQRAGSPYLPGSLGLEDEGATSPISSRLTPTVSTETARAPRAVALKVTSPSPGLPSSYTGSLLPQRNLTEYSKERVAETIERSMKQINATKQQDGGKELLQSIRDNNRSGLDSDIITCQATAETGITPGLKGSEGELGLLQIKPHIANSLGMGKLTDDQIRHNTDLNIKLATTYLGQLHKRFGNIRDALGAYKQGETSVAKKGLTFASQEYADRIIGCAKKLKDQKQ